MIAGVVLAALVLVAGLGPRGRIGGLLLGLLALVWFLVNNPMEGDTLVRVTVDHGLTSADLGGLAALVVAVRRLLRGAVVGHDAQHPGERSGTPR